MFHRISRARAASAALALWLLASARAHAAPSFELVGGALGDGGFNARNAGPGAASAYFNPALLARAEMAFEYGLFVLNDVIDVTVYARDPAVDVPDLALSQFQGQLPSVPSAWLQSGGLSLPELIATARWLSAELGHALPGKVSRAGMFPRSTSSE